MGWVGEGEVSWEISFSLGTLRHPYLGAGGDIKPLLAGHLACLEMLSYLLCSLGGNCSKWCSINPFE